MAAGYGVEEVTMVQAYTALGPATREAQALLLLRLETDPANERDEPGG